MLNPHFWQGKKVLITGHTGFKGSWLSTWLLHLGANVSGYSLSPTSEPNLHQLLQLPHHMDARIGDIRDLTLLSEFIKKTQPDIVFHLAAQPLVRYSYQYPIETIDVNVMGTANVLEAVKNTSSVQAFVNVTTDKVYRNREWLWGYREVDELGGKDPYSMSKVMSEMVTLSYAHSFFSQNRDRSLQLATARAGNVIGGGDWAQDRLVPDCFRALINGSELVIRNPDSIRPWQHVLEPLYGYLLLAEWLFQSPEHSLSHWNFGPDLKDMRTVKWMVKEFLRVWGTAQDYRIEGQDHWPESHLLQLDSSKANRELKWHSIWNAATTIEKVVEWYQQYASGNNMLGITLHQIELYQNDQRRWRDEFEIT